jgi:peptide chain release factor 3
VTTPVLFGSAVLNFGVRQLLDTLLELAPPPGPRPDVKGEERPLDTPFSAFVFKIQAGMDTAHRDRLAYVRVCSGVFERGTVVTHAATGKPFATKYAQQVFGRDRETVDVAYPGDVVGLVNASALRVGDSLYVGEPVVFPPIPSFAPEHFAVCRAVDSSRYKQFRRGIEQLEQEGTVQVLRSELRGDQAPVLAAVGPMQFEVAEHRMAGSSPHRCGSTGSSTRWPGSPTAGGARSSTARAASRCSSAAATARCSRCSRATGGCSACCATIPTRSSSPSSLPAADQCT